MEQSKHERPRTCDAVKTVMSGYALAPTMFLIEEEDRMLIKNARNAVLQEA
jgi:hypothetical protein